MAEFYAEIRGAKGAASRLGKHGMYATVASRSGAVHVDAFIFEGAPWVTIAFQLWSGEGREMLLYKGPLSGHDDAHLRFWALETLRQCKAGPLTMQSATVPTVGTNQEVVKQ